MSGQAEADTSLVCMLVFQAFPFILFLGVRQRNRQIQQPIREICLSKSGHWPGFVPLEEVGEFKGE